ncbi:hypothetical protein HHI36_004854 [Cryptolaemus montrouzieri]|uniref:Uncharacterized protein n=1 Tax=Cryptolaemus montrouzieri TaxID=559131 RepID=A0ABD2NSV1_9CUCU
MNKHAVLELALQSTKDYLKKGKITWIFRRFLDENRMLSGKIIHFIIDIFNEKLCGIKIMYLM